MTLEAAKLRKVIEMQRHALDRYSPCSDHSGKVNIAGEWECPWCRAERAERRVERLEARLLKKLSPAL